MGDVSHLVPSIHPMIGIDSDGAVNHQRAFADACATPSADQADPRCAPWPWPGRSSTRPRTRSCAARLMSEALAREAVALVEEADELEQEAELLAEAAEALAPSDPETAGELALAAMLLDSEADELSDAAAERLDEAVAIQDEAVLDQVANELADDAEDLGRPKRCRAGRGPGRRVRGARRRGDPGSSSPRTRRPSVTLAEAAGSLATRPRTSRRAPGT